MSGDGVGWKAYCRVYKWDADQVAWAVGKSGILEPDGDLLMRYVSPYEVTEASGNLTTNAGKAYLWANITGQTTTVSNYHQLANGYLPVGVGDGNGVVPTVSASDPDLTAPLNKYYQPVDASYPTVGAAGATAGTLTVQATFSGTVANFSWNEWGLFGSLGSFTTGTALTPSNVTMINHKGVALGTGPKTSGNVWTLNAVITLS